jgi:hypothetical protein
MFKFRFTFVFVVLVITSVFADAIFVNAQTTEPSKTAYNYSTSASTSAKKKINQKSVANTKKINRTKKGFKSFVKKTGSSRTTNNYKPKARTEVITATNGAKLVLDDKTLNDQDNPFNLELTPGESYVIPIYLEETDKDGNIQKLPAKLLETYTKNQVAYVDYDTDKEQVDVEAKFPGTLRVKIGSEQYPEIYKVLTIKVLKSEISRLNVKIDDIKFEAIPDTNKVSATVTIQAFSQGGDGESEESLARIVAKSDTKKSLSFNKADLMKLVITTEQGETDKEINITVSSPEFGKDAKPFSFKVTVPAKPTADTEVKKGSSDNSVTNNDNSTTNSSTTTTTTPEPTPESTPTVVPTPLKTPAPTVDPAKTPVV